MQRRVRADRAGDLQLVRNRLLRYLERRCLVAATALPSNEDDARGDDGCGHRQETSDQPCASHCPSPLSSRAACTCRRLPGTRGSNSRICEPTVRHRPKDGDETETANNPEDVCTGVFDRPLASPPTARPTAPCGDGTPHARE